MESGRYFTPEELTEKQVRDAAKAAKAADEAAQKEAEPAVKPPAEEPPIWNYNNIKHDHPNEIVLYQVGDFYEIYGEDAVEVAPMLDLTLSTKAVPDCHLPGRQRSGCAFAEAGMQTVPDPLQESHTSEFCQLREQLL